jgi:ABC-2 type transport system permease protein
VIADAHGPAAVLAMLAFDEDRYFAGRADEAREETTLLEVMDQDHLYYGKGALMMHALRERLGTASVDSSLRSLFAAHGGPGGMATSRDLRDALVARAASGLDTAMVEGWLSGRATYDLALDSATVIREGGAWRVHATMRASRIAPPGDVGVPLERDSVEILALDGPPDEGNVLHAARLPARDGAIVLEVPSATRPAWLALDPRLLKLEADRSDNEWRLVAPSSP